MKFSLLQVLVLGAVCATLVLANSGEEDSVVQRLLRTPRRKSYGRSRDDSGEAAPSGSAGGRDDSDSDESYYDNPKYQFAYQVKAKGQAYKKYGYGDDSSDDDDGQQGGDDSGDADSAEFGHAEMRDGQRTDGKYYVQLPDGRLQTVTYYVDGDSGFVAKVSYDDSGDDSGESNVGAVGGSAVGPSAGASAGGSAGGSAGARQGKDLGDDSDSGESRQIRRRGGKKYYRRG
jgi:hypothetical protein